jgi:hypothetical protein
LISSYGDLKFDLIGTDEQLRMVRFRDSMHATLFLSSGAIYDIDIRNQIFTYTGKLTLQEPFGCYVTNFSSCMFRGDFYDDNNRLLLIMCTEYSGPLGAPSRSLDDSDSPLGPDDCFRADFDTVNYNVLNISNISSDSTTYSTQMGAVLVEENSATYLDLNQTICCFTSNSSVGGDFAWGAIPDASGTKWISGVSSCKYCGGITYSPHTVNTSNITSFTLENHDQIVNVHGPSRGIGTFVIPVPDNSISFPNSIHPDYDYCLARLAEQSRPQTGNAWPGKYLDEWQNPLDIRAHPFTTAFTINDIVDCRIGGMEWWHEAFSRYTETNNYVSINDPKHAVIYTVRVNDVNIHTGTSISIGVSQYEKITDGDGYIKIKGLESEIGDIEYERSSDEQDSDFGEFLQMCGMVLCLICIAPFALLFVGIKS